MLREYIRNGKVIEAYVEGNDKKILMSSEFIDNMMKTLDIDEEEAVLTWLEDEEYLVNDEQEELTAKAKENKTHRVNARSDEPKKKTQRERVVKENPTKEAIIAEIARTIEAMDGTSAVTIENKAKIITFTLDGNEYKIDLIQKRKPKETK